MMLKDEIEKIVTDKDKLKRMKQRIVEVERQNLKTNEYTNIAMAQMVRKIVEDIADDKELQSNVD